MLHFAMEMLVDAYIDAMRRRFPRRRGRRGECRDTAHGRQRMPRPLRQF